MQTVEELNIKLNLLRQKWKNGWPKSSLEPNWWKFKCDSVLATQYKEQIRLLTETDKTKPLSSDEIENIAELIFGKK